MMTWLRLHGPRLVAGLALLTVATVTGVISYTHIYELTLALHQHEMAARLWAFGIDGLIVAGSIVLLQAVESQAWWLGWLGVGPGVALSVFANVESGIKYGWLAAAWAGTPAVSFALTTFMLERWLKAHAGQRQATTGLTPEQPGITFRSPVPADAQNAAEIALRATLAAGNPLSNRQLETRFGLTRSEATKVRELVSVSSNGHLAADSDESADQ